MLTTTKSLLAFAFAKQFVNLVHSVFKSFEPLGVAVDAVSHRTAPVWFKLK